MPNRSRTPRTGLAKHLRLRSTDAERLLWRRLRDRQLRGAKFRRQYPVGGFITDFVCLEASLIIELDGGQHQERAVADQERTAFLEKEGFRVLRYWNDQVLKETDAVLADILAALENTGAP